MSHLPCGVCGCACIISVADKVSDHPSDAEDASYAEDQPLADDGSVITAVYRPDDASLEFVLDGNSLGMAFARSVPSSLCVLPRLLVGGNPSCAVNALVLMFVRHLAVDCE